MLCFVIIFSKIFEKTNKIFPNFQNILENEPSPFQFFGGSSRFLKYFRKRVNVPKNHQKLLEYNDLLKLATTKGDGMGEDPANSCEFAWFVKDPPPHTPDPPSINQFYATSTRSTVLLFFEDRKRTLVDAASPQGNMR